jgi:hypothetical protein
MLNGDKVAAAGYIDTNSIPVAAFCSFRFLPNRLLCRAGAGVTHRNAWLNICGCITKIAT